MAKPNRTSANSRRILYLRFGVGLVLVIVILKWVDFPETIETIGRADIRYLALVTVIALLDRYVMAHKWAMLLRARGTTISNWEAFRIYLASSVVTILVPVGMSSDLFKLARTRQAGKDRIVASIIVERAVGFLAVVVVAVLGLSWLVLNGQEQFHGFYYVAWTLVVTMLTGFLLYRHFGNQERLHRFLSRYRKSKLGRFVGDAIWESIAFSRQIKVLSWFLGLSLLEQCIQVFMSFLAARALGLSLDVSYFFAMIPIANLLVALPISVNVIGVTEGVFILLFSIAGISTAQSLSLSLVMRAVGWLVLIPSILAFYYDSIGVVTLGRSSVLPCHKNPTSADG
jgi:uncharacterized protein (TIRG00374 family)